MAYKMSYISPDGEVFSLMDTTHEGVFVIEGGFHGLVGDSDDLVTSNVVSPGQVSHGISIKPTTGSLEVALFPQNGDTMDNLFSRIKNAFSRTREGTLILSDEDGIGQRTLPVRLSASIDPPSYNTDIAMPQHGIMTIPLISDQGVWEVQFSSKKTTTEIINGGEVITFPTIEWKQGGRVSLPSGASFTLPTVAEARQIHLSNAKSMMVTDTKGNIDRTLWREIAKNAWAEGIPTMSKRTFKIPTGATIYWSTYVLDPWR